MSALIFRELIRFFRQKGRVIATILTPIVFWFFLGSGISTSFGSIGKKFSSGSLEFFFPGMLLMLVLFSSVFSMISLIEDRDEGFLQSVLVSPISNFKIVASKVIAGTMLSGIQSIPFLLISIFLGYWASVETLVLSVICIVCVSFFMSSLSFILAWHSSSVSEFHSWMNLILFPMWILSGALFPLDQSFSWIRALSWLNPLYYAHQFLLSLQGFVPSAPYLPIVLFFCTISFFAWSLFSLSRHRLI
ncbi:MAG: ABC transporter permease [Bdellovibrionales bacterium]|nr:ABC transporter permease [Bdellovibrionales bacterium]